MSSQFLLRLERLSRRWIEIVSFRTKLAIAILVVISGLCYLPGQTILPAVDRTEGVVALSSRNIAQTGNPLDPRWGDNLQAHRPAGTFWVQAVAVSLLGKDGFTDISVYRLPSYLASVLAVVLIYALGRGLFGARPALLAALAVGVTPIVALQAQLAIAEPLILPLIVTSQFALFGVYAAPAEPRWLGWRGAFWVALGISTWFNALAAPLLALVTVLGLIIADRSARLLWRLAPWYGLPLFAIVALPWLISFWLINGGRPFAGFDWRQALDIVEGGQAMKFKAVHGVFVLFVALACIPVSHMLGPALAQAWSARRQLATRFLLVWFIAPIVALEICSNKPPLYTVQVVSPAVALLVAMALTGRFGAGRAFTAWPGFFTAASLFVLIAVPLFAGGLLWLTGTPPTLAIIIGGGAIIALFVVAGWAAAKGQSHAWFVAAIVATLTLNLWFFGGLMPGLANTWTAPQIRGVVDDIAACGGPDIVITGFREPSLPLALGKTARVLPAEDAGRQAAQSPAWAIIETRRRDAFETARAASAPNVRQTSLETRGCIHSINMARGCLLEFHVLAPDGSSGTRRTETQAGCPLGVPRTCPQAGRDKHWLDLDHCD